MQEAEQRAARAADEQRAKDRIALQLAQPVGADRDAHEDATLEQQSRRAPAVLRIGDSIKRYCPPKHKISS